MIWYPYEQMKTMKQPYKIVGAEGVYLYTEDQKLIYSVSSWWCMIHGYKHPELTEAIKTQADHFSHVMLGGLTHDPVLKLSEKLESFLPGDLDYCFFSDSGSVAVEVALKMARKSIAAHVVDILIIQRFTPLVMICTQQQPILRVQKKEARWKRVPAVAFLPRTLLRPLDTITLRKVLLRQQKPQMVCVWKCAHAVVTAKKKCFQSWWQLL